MTGSARLEASRVLPVPPDEVFALLCDPDGHVAIDASGMLQSAAGDPVRAVGDSFVVHMNRDALGNLPDWHDYDVTADLRSEPTEDRPRQLTVDLEGADLRVPAGDSGKHAVTAGTFPL